MYVYNYVDKKVLTIKSKDKEKIQNKHVQKKKNTNYRKKMALVINKMLSYREETTLQGALQFSPKVEDWNWETIFYGHYRSIFNHNRPENLLNSVKKRKIRAITAFKVIQGHRGRYQSKARMRFPISD